MIASLRAHARSLAALAVLACGTAFASLSLAQSVTTVAGGLVGDGLSPADAGLNVPAEIVFDTAGNLYVADTFNHRVRKVTPAGVVSTYAGNGMSGYGGDGGAATSAKLNQPWGLVFDSAGNLYISEMRGNRIRKVTPGGVISTYAGDGTTAVLNEPRSLAIDAGGALYVSESQSNRVRKIVGGVVSPFAGTGVAGNTGDNGPATAAKLRFPLGLLTLPDGSVLISDVFYGKIRRVDAAGTITTWRNAGSYALKRNSAGVIHVVGDGGVFRDTGSGFEWLAGSDEPWGFDGDSGSASDARFQELYGLALAPDGRIFISDSRNNRIRVYQAGAVSTFMGPGRPTEGGTAFGGRVSQPNGVAYDASGNLYVSERNLNRIRKITPAGVISTYAGSGLSGISVDPGNGADPLAASFYEVRGLAVTASGDLLVTEFSGHALRRISPAGQVSTVLPRGAVTAPDQLTTDAAGNIYVSHKDGISKIAPGGQLSTFVGNAPPGPVFYPENVSAATGTPTGLPGQMGFDAAGNFYYADRGFHTVRKVTPAGIVSTVAGIGGYPGNDGDGGPATSAHLLRPHALYVEPDGSFIIGDDNGRLRRVSNGVIQPFAGTAAPGFNGDGAASATQFDGSLVFARAPNGSLLVGDYYNGRLRRLPLGPVITIADVSMAEGNSGTKTMTFTVTLSKAQPGPVSFDIATANGTASGRSDFVSKSATGVVIAAGATSRTFNVVINGDTDPEPNETFTVNLGNPVGAAIEDGQATGTITNDDAAVAPTLSIGDVNVAEGNAGTKTATFTISLSAASASAVSFDIATASGTASGRSDYVSKSATGVQIATGATSRTFNVVINGDTDPEPNETFTVTLGNPVGATIADGQAVGTITNDDAAVTPALSIGDVSLAEGNSGTKTATFTISLSAAATSAVSFDIATANGSATGRSDYVSKSATAVQIAAGSTSRIFNVVINGDTEVEPNETFTVNLSNPVGATMADGQATGTITNDDAALAPMLAVGATRNEAPIAMTMARIDAKGLVDDTDDGNHQPQVAPREYALLLADTARALCRRAPNANVIAVEGVEHRQVLADLADTANTTCAAKPRYAAVMAEGDSRGFLVEIPARNVVGIQVLGKPEVDALRKTTSLAILGAGHARPVTVMLASGASPALARALQQRAKAQPDEVLVLLGADTANGLIDLTARELGNKAKAVRTATPTALPTERVLVSPSLLKRYAKPTILQPALPASEAPAQLLQLQ